MPICAAVVIQANSAIAAPTSSPRSNALVASSSSSSISRMKASPASTLASENSNPKVIHTIRMRVVSFSAAMTGNNRVIRSDSIRNSPMEISTRMITSAAISAVLNPAVRYWPPTISAMGRAISVKLMAAPPTAIASTKAEIKN